MKIVDKKSIIAISVGANLANPNGNIDNGEPRRTFNDCGIISPMSNKRKLRDLLEDHDSPLTQEIIRTYNLDQNKCRIFESKSHGMDGNMSEQEAYRAALELLRKSEEDALARFIDLRWFGGTILEEKKKGSLRFVCRGTVQFDMLQSLRPIETVIGGITRKASTQEKNQESAERQDSAGSIGQGAIKVVRNAIYTGAIRISPFAAHKTMTTTEDIEVLKALVPHMYAIKSAQRSGCEVMQAICMEHPSCLGVLPDHVFIDACKPRTREGYDSMSPSESFDEYEFPTIDEIVQRVRQHKNGSAVKITDLLS